MKTKIIISGLSAFLLCSCTMSEEARVSSTSHKAVASKVTTPGTITSLSLTSLPKAVRTHNPQLAAARNLVSEAQGRLAQAGLASNPELGIEVQSDTDFQDLMFTVGIDQKFPRTNRLALEKQVSSTLLQAAEAEIEDVERRIIGEARASLVEILAIREEKKLIQAQEANARKLADFTKEAASRGEASPLGAGTALIEAVRMKNRAKQIEIKERFAIATLKPLFGLAPDAPLQLADTLPTAKMPPLLVAASSRPDLEAATLRAQSAAEATALERAKKCADIEAGIFAGIGQEEDAPDGVEPHQIIGVRFTIPLPFNNDNSGAVAEATARHRRLNMEADALKKTIIAETNAVYQEMKQWSTLAHEIRTSLIPMADKQISQTQGSYSKGEIPLQDVLRAQEQKLSLETAHLEARRDFHIAHTKYLTATARY
jgi:cobalt-zinc-cadmium efflux system outer membrane protein